METLLKSRMIFLPGKQCDQRVWQSQIDYLSAIVDPIVIDLRYAGTLDEMINIIDDISEEPFILAGFSMGGYVALEFALKYPEKIKGLILVGCSAKGYSEKEKKDYLRLIEAVKNNKASVTSIKALQAYVDPSHQNNATLMNLIVSMAQDAGADVFVRQQTATLNRECRFIQLQHLNLPCLVIGATNDSLVDLENVKLTAASIPNASFHAVNESGHMIPLEQPEILNKLIHDWIIGQFYPGYTPCQGTLLK